MCHDNAIYNDLNNVSYFDSTSRSTNEGFLLLQVSDIIGSFYDEKLPVEYQCGAEDFQSGIKGATICFPEHQSSCQFNHTLKPIMFNQIQVVIVVVLCTVVNAVSMGGRVCHKTITKYTPEEFVNNIICKNGIYKQMLFKKVSFSS